ncbi:MAG: membrane protein [Rhizobiaceae bacterium MnEN-MB40S]|nr:MAG: membrane protein [Rhizobiaceae bacterium MnEN-MB40S]
MLQFDLWKQEGLPDTAMMLQKTPGADLPVQRPVLVASLAIALLLVLATWREGTTRSTEAVLLGLVAGVALYHASFGFTGAWRQLAVEARSDGLRAQFLLILLTCAVSFPLLEGGDVFGRTLHGAVAPFGVSAALGALLFGVGMQFSGSCASGTLFTAGGGNTRMIATLAGFILGSVVATAHMPFWWSLPAFRAYSLVDEFGAIGAFAFTALALGAIAMLAMRRELRRYGHLEEAVWTGGLLRGPWPKTWGAIALAVVSILTLVTLTHPWGITSAFALWGAKIANGIGVPVETWPYWSGQAHRIEASVFADATSVMNFGIVAGAFLAASLAGRFAPHLRITGKALLLSICGGLLMGYGARLAYGCNIGAYIGGVISGSLHGWGWLVFGFAGSLAGIRIRSRIAGGTV